MSDRAGTADQQSGAEAHAERVEESQGEAEEFNGIPGQIQYPDAEVDAERAAAFAAGKEDTLYEDDENDAGKSRTGWQNPADRPEEEAAGEPGVPGDESGEETEPAAMRHEPSRSRSERQGRREEGRQGP